MAKYKLVTAYDGTAYGGWQVQPNSPTIQEEIQRALKVALRQETSLTGSGRTDAGVHARAQCAHFICDIAIEPLKLRAALNGLLPHDIRILSIEAMSDEFHARYSATGKIYHYHLHIEPVRNPFTRFYATEVHCPLNVALLNEAAKLFLGTHDFTSFANEAHRGAAANKPVKTIKRLDVVEEPGGIRLEFEADGFLYKMVRNIVGTLLEAASGRCPLEKIPLLFAAKDRCKGAMAAPPQGLFLHQVLYTIPKK